MKYRVADLEKFNNSVFGADDILALFPAITTSGVNIVQQDDLFYIADARNNIVSDCAFFNIEEMKCLELA